MGWCKCEGLDLDIRIQRDGIDGYEAVCDSCGLQFCFYWFGEHDEGLCRLCGDKLCSDHVQVKDVRLCRDCAVAISVETDIGCR